MDETKKTNQEHLKEITDSIETGIKELFTSDKYRDYLRTMSRFHRYSFNNTMLIHMQRPDATRVASFNTWRDSFKRSINKGEKGIKIIAPVPYTKTVEQVKRDPDTQLPLLDAAGNEITEEKEVTRVGFKVVSVFDVSQTNGKPLPQLASDLTGDVQQYDAFLEAIKRSSPVPMDFKPLAPDTDGFFNMADQSITIRDGMSEVQTVCAAVHEMAHAKLHNTKEPEYDDKGQPVAETKSRRTEEVEAESIAFAVCAFFGIETGENSFGYIAHWSSGKELDELRESLEIINKTSSAFISDINRNFIDICKERGIDLAPPEQQFEEKEVLVLLDGNTYLHMQETDIGGVDFTLYDKETMKEIDGGQIDTLNGSNFQDAALAEVSVLLDLSPNTIEPVSLDVLDKLKSVESPALENTFEQAFMSATGDSFAIYQLNDTPAAREMLFRPYDRLSQPPTKDSYDCLYSGNIPTWNGSTQQLEDLFQQFNVVRPSDFTGHSMSVSDIVALQHEGVVSYYYCDRTGFRELPDFAVDNPLKNAEVLVEDDMDMIDGIINNGVDEPPSVADLEAQVKAGQTISLMDLAEAVQRESKERPSVLEALKKPAPSQGTKNTAPKKSAEMEI